MDNDKISMSSAATTAVQFDQNNNIAKPAAQSIHKGMTLTRVLRTGANAFMQLLGLKKNKRPQVQRWTTPVQISNNYSPAPQAGVRTPTTAIQHVKTEQATSGVGKTEPSMTTPTDADKIDWSQIPPPPPLSPQPCVKPAAAFEKAITLASTPEEPNIAAELKSPEYKIILNRELDAMDALRIRADDRFLAAVYTPPGFYSPQLVKMHQWFYDEFQNVFAKEYVSAREDGNSVALASKLAAVSATALVCETFARDAEPTMKNYAKLVIELQNQGEKPATAQVAVQAPTPEEITDKYVVSEAVSPPFMKFQKLGFEAREALLMKQEKQFLKRMAPNENETRSDKLEQAIEKYEAAFKDVVAGHYDTARKGGHSIPAALKISGKLAGDDACTTLRKSRDPSCKGFAKLMMKFQQNAVDTTSQFTNQTWTSITYERRPALQESMALFDKLVAQAPQPQPQPQPKPQADIPVAAPQSSTPSDTKQDALQQQEELASLRTATKLPDAGMPGSVQPLVENRTAAPAPADQAQIGVEDKFTPLPAAVVADAGPSLPVEKPLVPQPANSPPVADAEPEMPAIEIEAKKSARSLASLIGSSSQPSLKRAVKTAVHKLRGRDRSYDLITAEKKFSSVSAGNDAQGDANKIEKATRKIAKKAETATQKAEARVKLLNRFDLPNTQ